MFGSDEDEEAEKLKEQRLKEYAEKKAKKPGVIAKSSILLDVKPVSLRFVQFYPKFSVGELKTALIHFYFIWRPTDAVTSVHPGLFSGMMKPTW